MARKLVLGSAAAALICLGLAGTAIASAPIQLALSQGAAFSILGHSCGGIQEKAYATGFGGPHGRPTGDVYMQTRCGGSGRGGGYHVTTYSAWASVVWTWFGETFSFSRLEGSAGGSETFEETDAHGDRIYNSGTTAWLETGEPPLQPPAPPTGVSASVSLYGSGETEYLLLQVGWTRADETAGLITSSTVTATPVGLPGARAQHDRRLVLEQRLPRAGRSQHDLPRDGHQHRLRRDERTERADRNHHPEQRRRSRRTAARTAVSAANRTRARSSSRPGSKKRRTSRTSP